MAVTADSLLEPQGPLDAGFFPDEGAALTARLEAYIARGVAKVAAHTGDVEDEDGAVRSWALHLAFTALHLLKANNPNSASLDGVGSAGFASDQRKAFAAQAEEYRLQYLALAPVAPAGPPAARGSSGAVTNDFAW